MLKVLLSRFNYKCLNETCIHSGFQIIEKLPVQQNDPEYCETCQSPMKCMGELISGGLTMNFRNSSAAQRKEMLLKRSRKHFATSGLADKKRDLGERYKKEVIQKMKGDI